ncbi:MAG TPA: type II toxin-antitoxin system VapB family antitoxin [Spirochaetota bacterium]|nr:type II toxin-antitoxin system VapB family antitoxin [Spirochaetota bacterium]
MATNLAIDNNLLVSAKKIGKIKTKKETVNSALKEFIEKRKQEGIIDLFNSIEYDEKYNYKIIRNR